MSRLLLLSLVGVALLAGCATTAPSNDTTSATTPPVPVVTTSPTPVAIAAGTALTTEQAATCTAGDSAGGADAFGCTLTTGELAYVLPDGTRIIVTPDEPLPAPVLAAVTAAAEAPAPISNVDSNGPGGRDFGNVSRFYTALSNTREGLESATGKTVAIVYSVISDMDTGVISWVAESGLTAKGSHAGSLAATQTESVANVRAAATKAGIPESRLEIILRTNF